MAKNNITRTQRKLANEVRGLLDYLMLDPDVILADKEVEARIPLLKSAKDQIIRSDIVLQYVLMDELLNIRIRRHYFGKRNFRQLWKTKRYRSFQHFVLDKIYLLQKLELLCSLRDIPKSVRSDLHALNDLRNAILPALSTMFFQECLGNAFVCEDRKAVAPIRQCK